MVREYPVKKGTNLNVEYLREKTESVTGNAKVSGEHVYSNCKGLSEIDIFTDGKKLFVQTTSDGVRENAGEAVRIYNKLIEEITGFDSKERKKRMSKV